jgi:hypothetical protein
LQRADFHPAGPAESVDFHSTVLACNAHRRAELFDERYALIRVSRLVVDFRSDSHMLAADVARLHSMSKALL